LPKEWQIDLQLRQCEFEDGVDINDELDEQIVQWTRGQEHNWQRFFLIAVRKVAQDEKDIVEQNWQFYGMANNKARDKVKCIIEKLPEALEVIRQLNNPQNIALAHELIDILADYSYDDLQRIEDPEVRVTHRKIRLLVAAILGYMEHPQYQTEKRYDIKKLATDALCVFLIGGTKMVIEWFAAGRVKPENLHPLQIFLPSVVASIVGGGATCILDFVKRNRKWHKTINQQHHDLKDKEEALSQAQKALQIQRAPNTDESNDEGSSSLAIKKNRCQLCSCPRVH